MKKRQIITPYERLKTACNEAWDKLAWPKTRDMLIFIGKNNFPQDVYQRIKAAEELGYEVIIRAKDDGVHFIYREKIEDKDRPFLLRF
jgi:hypothetical protein